MLKFFKEYEKYIYPVILIIVFSAFLVSSWGKWGLVFYDTFREILLPEAMLNGKIFYKDILNLYPPLGYQLNAALIYIFGNSLNTLYWAGIINSALILSVVYFLAGKFSSRFYAFLITLSVMEIFTFRAPTTSPSWFFPYSYSLVYAFSACILGFLFYILYKKGETEGKDRKTFLFYSLFFSGLSIAFKLDFILCFILPFIEIIKKKSLKTLMCGLLCFFAPVLFSFLIYFITGGDINSLLGEFNFLMNFAQAPSVIKFNKAVMPQSFSLYTFSETLLSLIRFLIVSLIFILYLYFSLLTLEKLKNILFKILAGAGFLLFYLKIIIPIAASKQYIAFKTQTDLAFVPYFIVLSAILIFILKLQAGGVRNLKAALSVQEKFYLLNVIFALLISFRTFALIRHSYIGNFLFVIWWLCFIYFFVEILPQYLPKIFENKKFKAALCIFFMTFGLYFTHIYLFNTNGLTIKVNSTKGTIYAFKEEVFAINEGLNFIKENIRPDETLVVMDEGLIFNYLTDRKTDLKYYALIPHMVETYGEDKIISDFTKNPPDYVFITSHSYAASGDMFFGINYAKRVYQFIVKNYEHIKTIENKKGSNNPEDLLIEVYRVKRQK